MDARSRNKALFRSKLNALKKEKRIESPLVRYNESDQPVCRVCDLVLKSESFWDAHQASRKHHEAIANLKANATTGLTRASQTDLPKGRVEPPKNKAESSAHSAAIPKPASVLPSDFFDGDKHKRNPGGGSVHTQPIDFAGIGDNNNVEMSALSSGVTVKTSSTQPVENISQKSSQTLAPEKKQAKGAIPEGFFDNKDADMHARGIKPVKIDVKDEYKEFEKLIQADLQEVDDRMEEEEIDAAEMIEEAESMEQKAYRERVESLRKKRLELKAAAARSSAKQERSCREEDDNNNNKDLSLEGSSSDDDDDDNTVGNFAVDWRAQHL